MDFVHLHIHTEYSLLESACRIDRLVDRAALLGMQALAITDRSVMYGILPFYQACKKKGIKPILGLEVELQSREGNNEKNRLLFYAKNNAGYQNLIKLSSLSGLNREGIRFQEISPYTEGLIAVSSGVHGFVQRFLLENQFDYAIKAANKLTEWFDGEVYLGIEDHGLAKERELNLNLIQFSKQNDLQIVVMNDVFYINKEDANAFDALQAIKHGKKLSEIENESSRTEEHYLKNAVEMKSLFSHLPDAIEATQTIADKCDVELTFGKSILPKYSVPEGRHSAEFLLEKCMDGVRDRYGDHPSDTVKKRLSYELGIIDRMGFNDYFLIVWDFMKFARDRGILTGPGRGSAAGSLVSYVLQITQVDPIEHDLLFERFLNPERVTMPDIDIDFPDTKRDEVIRYVASKYGKEHVAQIITFGTLAAKAAVRDVGRVLSVSQSLVDQVAKKIPSRPGMTLERALKESPTLRQTVEQSEDTKRLWSIAKTIEGLPRHASTHAAGIVISDTPLTDVVPVQEGNESLPLTQYTMDGLEAVGLLKMDFLGLRNLTLLEDICSSIEKDQGVSIDLNRIPFDDQKTYELLSEGDTTGIFQLESDGMRKVLRNLKPTEFEDIVAVDALYRPGPMENIPAYIEGKHGKRDIHFPHPDLKPILDKTYGVIVYQEQIIQIASTMAGFSLGEADLLRRAVGKKKAEVLHEEREHFVKGAVENGYSNEVANHVYDLIVRFANYGFNRSHAVAYSVIAYQLAYLKTNYPTYFMAELLSSTIGNQGKTAAYLNEARQKGLQILPPSINDSHARFTVEDGNLRIGLLVIKNVGVRVIETVVAEREGKGQYRDLFDLCRRVSLKVLNKRSIESLILAGALDGFTNNRAQLLASLDDAIEYASKIQKAEEEGQIDLFGDEGVTSPKLYDEVPPFHEKEKLQFEFDALGFYLTGHPLMEFTSLLDNYSRSRIGHLEEVKKRVRLGALVTKVKTIKTKKGDWMAFVNFSDETGEMEGILFPKAYKIHSSIFEEGNVLLLEGTTDLKDGMKVIIDKAVDLHNLTPPRQVERRSNARLFLRIEKMKQDEGVLHEIQSKLVKFPGTTDVFLYYEQTGKTIKLSDEYSIDPVDDCIIMLESLLGQNNVVLK